MKTYWQELYKDINLPMIVCRDDGDFSVEYMNVAATLMFFPSRSVEERYGNGSGHHLETLTSVFDTADDRLEHLLTVLTQAGRVDHSPCQVTTFDGSVSEVEISANGVQADGERYYLFILFNPEHSDGTSPFSQGEFMAVVNAALLGADENASIDLLLAAAGKAMDVSRSYIFEEISPTTTRNTYEWCAPGVEPAIQGLQNLDKEDYPYDTIVESQMFIANDIMELDKETRFVLEVQGIKSLAIVTIYDSEGPIGYVGFDDTEKVREWTHVEIQFLKGLTVFLSALIKRRNSEEEAARTREILELVSDNSQEVIYANDVENYEILFVSKALRESIGKTEEELIGKPCYEMFRRDQHEPCDYCPIPKLTFEPGTDHSPVYEWVNNNEMVGKTFLVRDNLIKWVDGRIAHMEVAFDISERTEYEEQLQYYASMDIMTGILNRQWGGIEMERRIAEKDGGCLCFVDLDDLKKVNDQLGHAQGDDMLRSTVNALKADLREDELICRWGGDEFIIYFNRDLPAAEAAMAAVTARTREINASRTKPFKLSFS